MIYPNAECPPKRGVYYAWWRDIAGDRVVVAYTDDGRKVAELPFKPETERSVISLAWTMLDAGDPVVSKLRSPRPSAVKGYD